MTELKPTQHPPLSVVPAGTLKELTLDQIKPSTNNPRFLFDAEPLEQLKKNIAQHGVLVPLTVYQARGQSTFSILDGERRYRCVQDLTKEGHKGADGEPLLLPANVVEPPTKIAGLLYMFSIHNFREGWELMPTALSLKIVMEDLGETDSRALNKLTGLSEPQIERCKLLIDLPEKYQKMSLDPNPKTRIPSNFWIESSPVLDFALEEIPILRQLGRHRSLDKLVDKYQRRKIRSVIHFRRIMDAYEMSDGDIDLRAKVLKRTEEYFVNRELETRAAFDEFVVDLRRTQSALEQCDDFLATLTKLKIRYVSGNEDRKKLSEALRRVEKFCGALLQALKGSDDPDVSRD
jgi:hypothetical protein